MDHRRKHGTSLRAWLLAGVVLLPGCGGGSNAASPAGGVLTSAGAKYLNQNAAKRAEANGWRQFQATPVKEIDDPGTQRGIAALFRYSAVTSEGVIRGFLSVRGSDEDLGSLDLGSIVTPSNGPGLGLTYDLSTNWRDATQKTAIDFVHGQNLSNDRTSYLVAMGAGNQDNPLAIASYEIQGQTDAGLRTYFVTVVVHDQQTSIAAATSVPIGPQVSPSAAAKS